jgi:tight adherence protein C
VAGSLILVGSLAALGVAIVILAVIVMPAKPGEGGVAGALAAIEKSYASGRSAEAKQSADPFAELPGWLRGLALRMSPTGIAAKLQHRLDLAGNPDRWNPDRILGVKGLGLVVLAVLGMLVGARSPMMLILCTAGGGAIGFFLPDVLLYNAGLKRQVLLRTALPDAMDMLTICVEAGLGFDAALAQVARSNDGPLAAELARALQEMQIGKSRTEALRSMAARTTVPELRGFVSALVQAGELGISIAAVLREQAKEMRLRRRQWAEEQAQKVPVKILFPLLFCLFPALFIVVMGPAAIAAAHLFLHH